MLPRPVTYYLANINARLQMTKDPKPAGLDSTVTPKKVEPFLWALVLYFRIKQQEDSAKLDDRKAESKAAPRIECLRKPKEIWL